MTSELVRGSFSRSRDLATFNKKFKNTPLETVIANKLSKNKTLKVLEVGCGEGRVLMQLKKMFPTVQFFGINKKPWSAMRGTQDLKKTAKFYKIFNNKELKSLKLPQIYFYDAEKLKFATNSIDVMYSQVSIPYIARKDLFFEEAWRVLKLGGVALLHFSTKQPSMPKFLTGDSHVFVIRKKEKLVSLNKFFNTLRNKGFDLTFLRVGKTKQKYVLIMRKNTNKKLDLHLHFEEKNSFDIQALHLKKIPNSPFWGYRSVYQLK